MMKLRRAAQCKPEASAGNFITLAASGYCDADLVGALGVASRRL
jgi:hypothetical protein